MEEKHMKKQLLLAAVLSVTVSSGITAAAAEPVVIENMGRSTTYEEAPESAVALSYSIAEVMIAEAVHPELAG